MSPRRITVFAVVAATAWLLLGIPILHRYGPTWDCTIGEYPLGESLLHALTSEASLRDAPLHAKFGALRDPHPDFRQEIPWSQCWPLASILSAASCRIFWSSLAWMPAMSAHHLPVVAMVALLVFAMVRWTGTRAGLPAALLAPLLLLTSPRFFADAINNLKDMPETVLYTGALLVAARAVRGGGRRWWLLAGALGGASLAQKANAIFLPIEVCAWVGLCRIFRVSLRDGDRRRDEWVDASLGLLAFVACYFALSPQFWFDPIERLRLHYTHVFRTGNAAYRAADVPNASPIAEMRIDPDGAFEALWTTPIPILLLFLFGLGVPTLSGRDRLLLCTGALLPIARTLLPGMVNFDGVRHYEEFVPPMCIVAAAGLSWLAARVAGALRRRSGPIVATCAALTIAAAGVAPGACATLATHPNGCTYFNALVGGLRGAQLRHVRDATDYWGNSYWQAADWLNDHAEREAAVVARVGSHILRAIAPVKLRSGLHLSTLDDAERDVPIYLLYITRADYYDRFVAQVDRTHPVLHELSADGAPILRIHRFAAGDDAGAALAEMRAVDEEARAWQVVSAVWAAATPERAHEIVVVVRERHRLGHDEALRRLRALLPADLSDRVEAFLRVLDANEKPPAAPEVGGK